MLGEKLGSRGRALKFRANYQTCAEKLLNFEKYQDIVRNLQMFENFSFLEWFDTGRNLK